MGFRKRLLEQAAAAEVAQAEVMADLVAREVNTFRLQGSQDSMVNRDVMALPAKLMEYMGIAERQGHPRIETKQ